MEHLSNKSQDQLTINMRFIIIICKKIHIVINQTTETSTSSTFVTLEHLFPLLHPEEEKKMFIIREFRFIKYLVFFICNHFLITFTSFEVNPMSRWWYVFFLWTFC